MATTSRQTLGGESLAERYNPCAPPQLEDPYSTYAIARREAPVFFSHVLQMWVVTRYDDVCTVLRDPATFSSENMLEGPYERVPEALRVLAEGNFARAPLTVDNDPPDHTRVRSTVNRTFTPARAARLEPAIHAIANELIDAIERDGRADLVTQFATALPSLVILDMLGLPREDAERINLWVKTWAGFIWAPLSPEQQVESAHAIVEYMNYCVGQVQARKASPRDDLLSDLLRSKGDDAASLSETEVALMINDLLFAGQTTITHTIGNAMDLLLTHPDARAAVKDDPSLLPGAIEEVFRRNAPTQSLIRTAKRDAQVAGTMIPTGAHVCVVLGSANHDEAYSDDPMRFDVHRKLDKHLSFGHGIHYCVGAGLARLEVRVAIATLLHRLRNLRLEPGQTITWIPNLIQRGPAKLMVVWDA